MPVTVVVQWWNVVNICNDEERTDLSDASVDNSLVVAQIGPKAGRPTTLFLLHGPNLSAVNVCREVHEDGHKTLLMLLVVSFYIVVTIT
eukprot:3896567-Amphidinium_carterae.1